MNLSQFFRDCTWGFLLLLSLAFAGGERVRAIFGVGGAKPSAAAGKREGGG
jgi:simple sugar transport system permease protein